MATTASLYTHYQMFLLEKVHVDESEGELV